MGQTAPTDCRTQTDKATAQACLCRTGPFYPFSLLFSPHLVLPKWPQSLPLAFPLKIPQPPNALLLHPMPPQPARGASPPLTHADGHHLWPMGQWIPWTALGRSRARFSEWITGGPLPASTSVTLCVHVRGDKPSRVGCSHVTCLGVARSAYHPGSPPTVVPLCSLVHTCADRLLNHITLRALLLWAFHITVLAGRQRHGHIAHCRDELQPQAEAPQDGSRLYPCTTPPVDCPARRD